MSEIVEMEFVENDNIEMDIQGQDNIELEIGQSAGTSNYNALSNKPQINGVVLEGNKTSKEIKVQSEMNDITEQDIDNILYGGNL